MRLDNRPKTIAVTFTDGTYSGHEEALRQFLLFNNLDSANLSKHPDRDDMALIAFTQRFEGENFMAQATNSELTHIGKVDLSWYKPEDKPANGGHEMSTAIGQAGHANAGRSSLARLPRETRPVKVPLPTHKHRFCRTYTT